MNIQGESILEAPRIINETEDLFKRFAKGKDLGTPRRVDNETNLKILDGI